MNKGTFAGVKNRRKEGQLVELVGDQNTSPEVPHRRKSGRKMKEQRRCRGRNKFHRSDGEEHVCQGH